ncbi:SH3 domain-binding protein 2 isoform X1 [Astyanax mexicanus]|uniref:SH3 domain-binding protein 2 isoform X1 n=2 Tax=Astyanax mexicanus TaxID=7994 RepID=UPI0020CAC79D|nr:SH3 domain-binding protein 2 isoform X1 [Astyanax mexicanus]
MDLLPDQSSAASMFSESSAVKGIRRRMRKRNMAAAPISWPNPMRAIGAQNLLTMPGGVSLSGYLHKKGGSQFSLMKWPLRYIIIHRGCVYYFKTSTSATPQGAFSLNGYNRVMRAAEETTSSNVFPFKIVHFSKKHRTWYFSAASEDERRKWMRHLRKEINYYTDKKDFHDPGESDSDAESFYGPIESPLEITEVSDHPDSEFIISDEEDYLQPDGPTVRPTAPPPSYPPPPVPNVEDRITPPSTHPKGHLPPLPPPPNKTPPCPERNKTSLSFPSPPPLLPPLPSKPVLDRFPKPSLPIPSPTYPKKPVAGRVSGSTLPVCEKRHGSSVVITSPSTLPICRELEEKVVLNTGEKPKPFSIHNNHKLAPKPEERKPNCSSPIGNKSPNMLPKPPPPGIKPKLGRPSLQRSSPDGQSFRSSVEENPLTKRVRAKHSDEESDDDYENVQLPDSVFVDTTETSAVEKLFKEEFSSPKDGLYCIRNSGTKTSKVLVVWDVSLNKARNYRVFEEDSTVFLETDVGFPSLAALVEHYHSHPLPNHGSLCLQQPYGYKPPR